MRAHFTFSLANAIWCMCLWWYWLSVWSFGWFAAAVCVYNTHYYSNYITLHTRGKNAQTMMMKSYFSLFRLVSAYFQLNTNSDNDEEEVKQCSPCNYITYVFFVFLFGIKLEIFDGKKFGHARQFVASSSINFSFYFWFVALFGFLLLLLLLLPLVLNFS